MDVRKWLQEVVLPEKPPSLPDRLGLPQFLHPKRDRQNPSDQAGASASAHKHRQKDKPVASDSSILQARQHHKRKDASEHEEPVIAGANRASSPAEHRSDRSSSVSHASDHRYQRKPRHKTRPDLYEPKQDASNERGSRRHRRGQDESRKGKRKSRRKKTDNPGAGLVHSFHANNVPRDRLTLKPREKLGIFNKGRASTPVKGRGLPDLVFSEMKFLQKRKDAPEETHKEEEIRKRRKKDHAQANEHEMSAYFTSLRPPLAERDTNIQSHQHLSDHRTIVPANEHKKIRSASIETPIPTVELPEKPYLGFGGRGARHESSYLSWSETDRLTTQSPDFRRALTTIDIGQLESAHRKQNDINATAKAPFQRPTNFKSPSHRTVDRNSRPRASSSLPASFSTHRPPSRGKFRRPQSDPQNRTRVSRQDAEVLDTSPEVAAASPRKEWKRVTHRHPVTESYSDSKPSVDEARETSRDQQGEIEPDTDGPDPVIKTDTDPDTSSTFGKLLRECESAAAQKDAWPDQQQHADRRPAVQFAFANDGSERGENSLHETQQLQVTPPQLQLDQQDHQWDMYSEDADMEEIHLMLRADRQMENYDDGLSYLPNGISSTRLGRSEPSGGLELEAGGGNQQHPPQAEEGIFASFWRPHKLY
ncbi:uncharacterized protein BDZ99DRAFT_103572 [Mytilinidion resinicola]|uniref:Uncharacterized protein n=1 Tax=Mytilinidion resinicola TaxID=574789 RepID=A0A6A6YC34_9PEZI|nr:uncharacterized protein BDZ99DRAFT_103572 [Mytilinidion resinicola]KAF2806073.1 hypothetical protein BDZ99DRAFT_103572 [Mytilinidion resinicola]